MVESLVFSRADVSGGVDGLVVLALVVSSLLEWNGEKCCSLGCFACFCCVECLFEWIRCSLSLLQSPRRRSSPTIVRAFFVSPLAYFGDVVLLGGLALLLVVVVGEVK
jgi:hypothetical protein